ncbi:MAG: hypothetical protein LBM99_06445, partial [Bacillales bacterium]|nr:hypothetical protein [Bacillales bacterium]
MQELSFRLQNDHIIKDGYEFYFEIFSFNNQYTVLPHSFIKKDNTYYSDKIIWGGNQDVKGDLTVSFNNNKIEIKATLFEKIRSLKTVIKGIKQNIFSSSIDKEYEVNEYGKLITYPEGWRSPLTPLIVLRQPDYFYLYSAKAEVLDKRFFLKKENDTTTLEAIYAPEADKENKQIETAWIYGTSQDISKVINVVQKLIVNKYHLKKLEERKDLPIWFKDISLVLTCHMQHWTGNIFHTYAT